MHVPGGTRICTHPHVSRLLYHCAMDTFISVAQGAKLILSIWFHHNAIYNSDILQRDLLH